MLTLSQVILVLMGALPAQFLYSFLLLQVLDVPNKRLYWALNTALILLCFGLRFMGLGTLQFVVALVLCLVVPVVLSRGNLAARVAIAVATNLLLAVAEIAAALVWWAITGLDFNSYENNLAHIGVFGFVSVVHMGVLTALVYAERAVVRRLSARRAAGAGDAGRVEAAAAGGAAGAVGAAGAAGAPAPAPAPTPVTAPATDPGLAPPAPATANDGFFASHSLGSTPQWLLVAFPAMQVMLMFFCMAIMYDQATGDLRFQMGLLALIMLCLLVDIVLYVVLDNSERARATERANEEQEQRLNAYLVQLREGVGPIYGVARLRHDARNQVQAALQLQQRGQAQEARALLDGYIQEVESLEI